MDLMASRAPGWASASAATRFPKKETLHHVYSRHMNTEIPVDDVLRDEFPQFADDAPEVRRIFADYTARKDERNLVDYDDLLLFWARHARGQRRARDAHRRLYDHVLVDEYQDTNLLQARILRGMCRTHRNITVVGDDAQSIYSFRGANVRNILDFPAQFPGAHDRRARAELSLHAADPRRHQHASSRAPASATRRTSAPIAPAASSPWLVTARDEHEQTRWVVDRVLELHEAGTPLREMAVLFRAGYMSADLEIELDQPQDPVREVGRPQVPRGRAREGRARVPARSRESARRGELVSRPAAASRRRRGHGALGDRAHRRARRGIRTRSREFVAAAAGTRRARNRS